MAILSRPVHQVFINFRGKDVRYSFASHLTDALKRHNIKFFIDTHEQKGRDLKHLFKRIKEASVALVILSTRYGESKWCLEELMTIMEQAKEREMIVIPIFYKVRPEEVRKQQGVFGSRFWSRAKESNREEIEKWQVALKAVCNKIGFTLDHNRCEATFIRNVVKEVENVLAASQSDEGREDDSMNVKTYNVPLALPWTWIGTAVGVIGAVLSILVETVHKCASPPLLFFLVRLALLWRVQAIGLIGLSEQHKCKKRFLSRLFSLILWLQLQRKSVGTELCNTHHNVANSEENIVTRAPSM